MGCFLYFLFWNRYGVLHRSDLFLESCGTYETTWARSPLELILWLLFFLLSQWLIHLLSFSHFLDLISVPRTVPGNSSEWMGERIWDLYFPRRNFLMELYFESITYKQYSLCTWEHIPFPVFNYMELFLLFKRFFPPLIPSSFPWTENFIHFHILNNQNISGNLK